MQASILHRHHRGGLNPRSHSRQCWPAGQSGQDGRATGAVAYVGLSRATGAVAYVGWRAAYGNRLGLELPNAPYRPLAYVGTHPLDDIDG